MARASKTKAGAKIGPDEGPLDDSPAGKARRWKMEMDAAARFLKPWLDRADEVLKRYLDERSSESKQEKRLNLLYSDTQIRQSLLYGKLPKVDAGRRYADANDDVARVGSEMLDRLLNTDIEKGSDTYASALWNCLEDWLLPGLGQVKVRYKADFGDEVPGSEAEIDDAGTEIAPAVAAYKPKTDEHVYVDYYSFRRFRWSPCGIWEDARWVAFENPMSRDDLIKRFGDALGKEVPLDAKRDGDQKDEGETDPAARASVWEIWSKDDLKVYWWAEGYPAILDEKPDPLGLDGFFPCPRPLAANTTTSKYIPVPDYYIAQDLYQACDRLFARKCLLIEAIAVRGSYDKTVPEIGGALDGKAENKLYPSDNWGAFTEKGGYAGAVAFFPLEEQTKALAIVSQQLEALIQLLYQVTGMSDIMRGAAQNNATATEQSIKAKFGSIRSQKKQDEFARFATEILQIKGEIIAKHFDVQTIIKCSNISATADAQFAEPAAQLIKDEFASYRIEVKPEAVSMTDYASLQQERIGALGALGQFLGAAVPVLSPIPGGQQLIMDLGQWLLGSLKGSSGMESAFDRCVAAMEQAQQQAQQQGPPPPPPDPKLETTKVKVQGDLAKTHAESQARMAEIQAETHADITSQLVGAHLDERAAQRADAMKAVDAATDRSRPA